VLGLPKNESLEFFRDNRAVFGLQMLRPVRTTHVSINLLDTKGSRDFRPKAVNPHTTMRYEIIREPRYRLIFGHSTLAKSLHDVLMNGEMSYTPCLGLAWMIAWFEGKPSLSRAEELGTSEELQQFVSPVRANDLDGDVQWRSDSVYQRIRMPAEMLPDRRVTRYEEYIIDTTGAPIETRLKSYWKLADGTCFSAL
jgi:CRISPR-associated protein Cas5 subtype I-B